MSIIASVPAPAGSRLIDADTANLTAPAVGRFTVNPAYRPLDERGNPELCPAWCAGACGDTAERSHVRPIIDMTARHGDLVTDQVEIRAQLQAFESPYLPGGIEPTEVWMQVFHGDDGVSAALTADEAERIGQALLDAAGAARQARR